MYFSPGRHALINVYNFYRNGFRTMTVGRTLWKIILLKLLFMFVILKLFLLPNYLKTNFHTDEQRTEHVLEQLTHPAAQLINIRSGDQ